MHFSEPQLYAKRQTNINDHSSKDAQKKGSAPFMSPADSESGPGNFTQKIEICSVFEHADARCNFVQ